LGTIEGKILFERKMASLGHTVEHYHADSGVFAALKWKEACIEAGRGYSYSRVNAHFQSGIADRRTRELQEHERAMPIHAHTRWPEAIPHLWLYALRPACDVFNEAPTKKLKRSPLEPVSSSTEMPEPKHWKPFGCPVYVLDSALQNSGGIKHK
jgi:hypothetical protein